MPVEGLHSRSDGRSVAIELPAYLDFLLPQW
jgi:hypothetical protein